MSPRERADSTSRLIEECYAVMRSKEVDYASKEDVLANFKRNAERIGLTKYHIWATYANKHWDAICNAIQYHPHNPATETKTEPLRGRVVDAINYLTILVNLMDEDQTEGAPTPKCGYSEGWRTCTKSKGHLGDHGDGLEEIAKQAEEILPAYEGSDDLIRAYARAAASPGDCGTF